MSERPAQVTEAMLVSLDRLRVSGVTNMYGAGPYLVEAFGLSRAESHTALAYWMRTFGARQDGEAR